MLIRHTAFVFFFFEKADEKKLRDCLHFLTSTWPNAVFIFTRLSLFHMFSIFQNSTTQWWFVLSSAASFIFGRLSFYLVCERQTVPQWQVLLGNKRRVRCPLGLGRQIGKRLGWKTQWEAWQSANRCISCLSISIQDACRQGTSPVATAQWCIHQSPCFYIQYK